MGQTHPTWPFLLPKLSHMWQLAQMRPGYACYLGSVLHLCLLRLLGPISFLIMTNIFVAHTTNNSVNVRTLSLPHDLIVGPLMCYLTISELMERHNDPTLWPLGLNTYVKSIDFLNPVDGLEQCSDPMPVRRTDVGSFTQPIREWAAVS